MEREQKKWITTHFQHLDLPTIDVLGIPDEYEVMDPELQEILRLSVEPELNHLLEIKRPRS
ncbi:MAG: hypothetical protein QM790_17195 [Nibricoccus sp.]